MNERVLTISIDDEGIMRSQLHGSVTADRIPMLEQDIENCKSIVREEYQKRGLQLRSLIDLTDFEGTYVPKAISILAAYMKANKPFVLKSAAFGGKDMTNLAANIVASIAGRDNLMFFKSKEQAEAWIHRS